MANQENPPHYDANGLTIREGYEVPMSWPELKLLYLIGSDKHQRAAIWTRLMQDCCSIAVYDRITRNRALIHVWGSLVTEEILDELAPCIGAHSTIIIAAGHITGSDWIGITYRIMKETITPGLKDRGVDMSGLEWEPLCEKTPNNGTLILLYDGTYGRAPAGMDLDKIKQLDWPVENTERRRRKKCIIS